VFNRIFKREKPKVYLGKITVVPRGYLKRSLENNLYTGESLEDSLEVFLNETFDMPLASECAIPNKTDLAIDVIIENFQAGNYLDLHAGDFSFPIFWRPKIEIASKLYIMSTGETKNSVSITVKLPWKEYFSRLFTWRAFFGFRPMFDTEDMEKLLARACLQLLQKLIRVV